MTVLRPCATAGCSALTSDRRCARHALARKRADNDRRHAKQRAHGRDLAHWQRIRAAVRARSGGRCELRLRGCLGVALSVHLDPALQGRHDLATPADAVDACAPCHGRVDGPRAAASRRDAHRGGGSFRPAAASPPRATLSRDSSASCKDASAAGASAVTPPVAREAECDAVVDCRSDVVAAQRWGEVDAQRCAAAAVAAAIAVASKNGVAGFPPRRRVAAVRALLRPPVRVGFAPAVSRATKTPVSSGLALSAPDALAAPLDPGAAVAAVAAVERWSLASSLIPLGCDYTATVAAVCAGATTRGARERTAAAETREGRGWGRSCESRADRAATVQRANCLGEGSHAAFTLSGDEVTPHLGVVSGGRSVRERFRSDEASVALGPEGVRRNEMAEGLTRPAPVTFRRRFHGAIVAAASDEGRE
ncbi:MAG TPA: hypothetical protein VM204_04205 [Gaiellaceae bacterium]|nr:hypothetical protein [Gaiellaceae bacterium]